MKILRPSDFVEGIHYRLAKGKRWWPIGRKFALLFPVDVGVKKLPAGKLWDGPTMWPVWENSPLAYPSLVHDIEDGSRLKPVIPSDLSFLGNAWRFGYRLRWPLLAAAFLIFYPVRLAYRFAEGEWKDGIIYATATANLAGIGYWLF